MVKPFVTMTVIQRSSDTNIGHRDTNSRILQGFMTLQDAEGGT